MGISEKRFQKPPKSRTPMPLYHFAIRSALNPAIKKSADSSTKIKTIIVGGTLRLPMPPANAEKAETQEKEPNDRKRQAEYCNGCNGYDCPVKPCDKR